MKARLHLHTSRRGSALITTLLVVVVMSIIVVAFLQSMTMEKQTARSYLNRLRAEMAATAGADMAKALIYETITKTPGRTNFVTWAYSPDPKTFSPFFTGILPDAIPTDPDTSDKHDKGINSVSGTVWLFSGPGPEAGKGTNPQVIKDIASGSTRLDICNINFPISTSRDSENNSDSTSSTDAKPHYWIDQSGTEYNVGWVPLPTEDNTSTENPSLDPPPDTPPKLTVRYAFWVDDEMGRADLGVLGNASQKVPKGDAYKYKYDKEMGATSNLVLNDADKKEVGDQKYLEDADMKKIDDDRETAGLSPLSANQLITPFDSKKTTLPNPNLVRDSLRITAHAPEPSPTPSDAPSVYDLVPYGAQAGTAKMNLNDTATQGDDAKERVKKIHDFLANSLAEEKAEDGKDIDETDKKKTSFYFRRKNSPAGTGWRIAASIHDYIDTQTYPTMAEQLEDHFSERLENAYQYVFGSDAGKGDPKQPVKPDWEDIYLDQRWYGIKPVPFFNAFEFDGTMNSTKSPYNNYTAKYTFYLWNPSDKVFEFKANEYYIMIFNSSFRPQDPKKGTATRTDTGAKVEGLPYYRWDVFRVPAQKMQPMQQTAISLSKNYKINGDIGNANLNTTADLGFILFQRSGDSKIHVLDGFYAAGGLNYNRDSKSPGGQVTGASNEWDTKDRRQTLSLHQSIWSTATTAVKGSLANFQDIKRWYDRPDASDTPTTPILHIPLDRMKSLGELGNIFDPVNDLSVGVGSSYPTGGQYPLRTLPGTSTIPNGGGTFVSRGGKTLDVGQFDEFFDRLQTSAPKNPLIDEKADKWSAYEKYLRFGDAALYDMFTVRTPEESRKIRPLNVNAPRPGKLPDSKNPGDPGLDPLSTYFGAMTSTLGTDALGGKDKNNKPFQGMNTGIQNAGFLAAAFRDRLTDSQSTTPDWTKCRPFRNYNDLMLLGIKKDKLEKDIQANASQAVFSAKNATTTGGGTVTPFYLTKRGAVTVTLGTPPGGPTGTATVQLGTNYQRQAPFARFAEQATFRSYRYRIYAVGQVVSAKDPRHPLATAYQSFIYDLNPKYDETTKTVTFHPTLQSVADY